MKKKDIKIQKLEDLLKKIFEKHQVFDYATIDELSDELTAALQAAKRINQENDRLPPAYGGSFAFVKTLSDAVLETTIDRSEIESFLKIIFDIIKDTIYDDALIVQGKKGFVDATKAKITIILIKEKLFKKVKESYDDILEMLYVNLLLYKESI